MPIARKKSPAKRSTAALAREELVARVGIHVRKMSAQSVLTSQVVAERFALHTTDLEVLDLITLREQATAGELAIATGLTSGSVTALIDRLAAAGYVERYDDPDDRRRVQVRIRHDAIAPIMAVYEPMQARMFRLWSTFSASELELVADFLSRSTELAVQCIDEMQRGVAPFSSPASKRSPPRGSRRAGARPASAPDRSGEDR